MPADFAIIAPGNSTTAIPLVANTPLTFTWQDQPETPPAGVEVLPLLAFTNAAFGPLVICLEPNDGSITVPAAMIDAARGYFPAGATIARQTLTHQVRGLVDSTGRTGKRIDFLGVWCYAAQPFTSP